MVNSASFLKTHVMNFKEAKQTTADVREKAGMHEWILY